MGTILHVYHVLCCFLLLSLRLTPHEPSLGPLPWTLSPFSGGQTQGALGLHAAARGRLRPAGATPLYSALQVPLPCTPPVVFVERGTDASRSHLWLLALGFWTADDPLGLTRTCAHALYLPPCFLVQHLYRVYRGRRWLRVRLYRAFEKRFLGGRKGQSFEYLDKRTGLAQYDKPKLLGMPPRQPPRYSRL